MKYLLDTHIWVWSVSDTKRLSPRVRQGLQDSRNEFWLSPVSTWEILLLHAKGRIQLPSDVRQWVEMATASFRQAPLTHEIVLAAQDLPFSHSDPADRFLAATAGALGLILVTADLRLLGLGTIATLANR